MSELLKDVAIFLSSKEFWSALISGGLTVLAGWWAFKATTEANTTARKIEAQKLYAEWINAANAVRNYAVTVYQLITNLEKPAAVLGGRTVVDVLSQTDINNADCWIIYQILNTGILQNERPYSDMFPHLAILGEEPLDKFTHFAESVSAFGWNLGAYIDRSELQAPPAGRNALALQAALKNIFLAQGNTGSLLGRAKDSTMTTIEFFREKSREYQRNYEKLAKHFTHLNS